MHVISWPCNRYSPDEMEQDLRKVNVLCYVREISTNDIGIFLTPLLTYLLLLQTLLVVQMFSLFARSKCFLYGRAPELT